MKQHLIAGFNFPFKAVPKGRPRVNRKTGVMYTPKETREFEDMIAQMAAISWRKEPIKDRLRLEIDFEEESFAVRIYRIEGKNHKADLDNLAKSVIDALQGIIFVNDSQIDELELRRK